MDRRYAMVPGDGIGIDVTREAVKVLEAASEVFGFGLTLEHFDYGAERYLTTGETLPDGALAIWSGFDAIFMGAFGDPRVPDMKHAADILLGTRFRIDLYANVRPVRCLAERLCPLRDFAADDVDFVVFRENTEGRVRGDRRHLQEGDRRRDRHPGGREHAQGGRADRPRRLRVRRGARAQEGDDVGQVERPALRPRPLAARVRRGRRREYPGIEANHLYVDALTMQMIKDPRQFEVIVTCNMFGDIVTDLGAALQGGLGMAASGNIHPGQDLDVRAGARQRARSTPGRTSRTPSARS